MGWRSDAARSENTVLRGAPRRYSNATLVCVATVQCIRLEVWYSYGCTWSLSGGEAPAKNGKGDTWPQRERRCGRRRLARLAAASVTAMLPLGARFRAPAFWWERRSLLSDAMLPLAAVYSAASWLHKATSPPPVHARAPVVCVGSVMVGGAGKTPVALAVAEHLASSQLNLRVHFLSRGYGGSASGPLRVVAAEHDAVAVGDEPLLLAAQAPTWVGARRSDTAAAACDAGAQLLLMDDGLQHHSLHRDLCLLCVDSTERLGNGRVLPAGPLREPLSRALAKSDAVVAVQPFAARDGGTGVDVSDNELRAALRMPEAMPLLRARMEPEPSSAEPLRGATVLAFSATARPHRFFDTLLALGCHFPRPPIALPDHAPIPDAALDELRRDAASLGATLATTSKDFVRLRHGQREGVSHLAVRLRWLSGSEGALDGLLHPLIRGA